MNSEEVRKPFILPSRAMRVAVSIWMLSVFLFYLFLFTPTALLSVADQFNLRGPLMHLRALIQPFFQTSDSSDYVKAFF